MKITQKIHENQIPEILNERKKVLLEKALTEKIGHKQLAIALEYFKIDLFIEKLKVKRNGEICAENKQLTTN